MISYGNIKALFALINVSYAYNDRTFVRVPRRYSEPINLVNILSPMYNFDVYLRSPPPPLSAR